ncbi:MAG: hypothetical protein ACL93V_13435 [Candidatus Electrothrix sp. YB6]
METLPAQMTKEELIETIENIVERKLAEFIERITENELRPEVTDRLLAQKKQVASGERGQLLNRIAEELDLVGI